MVISRMFRKHFRSVISQFPGYKIPDSVTDALVVFAFKPPYNPHGSIVVLALSFPQAGNEAYLISNEQ